MAVRLQRSPRRASRYVATDQIIREDIDKRTGQTQSPANAAEDLRNEGYVGAAGHNNQKDGVALANHVVLSTIRQQLEKDPMMDMRQLLQDVSSTYDLNKEAFRGTLLSTRQSVEALDQDYALTEVQRKFQVPAESMVQAVYPLSDPVQVLLGQAVQDSPRVRSGSFEPDCVGSLNKLVAEGPELWTLGSLSVLQVSPEVVLKVGLDLDVDYLADLQHVKQQAPSVPLPRILGALRADKLTFA